MELAAQWVFSPLNRSIANAFDLAASSHSWNQPWFPGITRNCVSAGVHVGSTECLKCMVKSVLRSPCKVHALLEPGRRKGACTPLGLVINDNIIQKQLYSRGMKGKIAFSNHIFIIDATPAQAQSSVKILGSPSDPLARPACFLHPFPGVQGEHPCTPTSHLPSWEHPQVFSSWTRPCVPPGDKLHQPAWCKSQQRSRVLIRWLRSIGRDSSGEWKLGQVPALFHVIWIAQNTGL